MEHIQQTLRPNRRSGNPRRASPSRTMNPSLPQSVVDRAIERDPASAAAEFGAQFRTDIEAFVNIEAVRACVSSGVYERAPIPGVSYCSIRRSSRWQRCRQHDDGIGHIDHAKQIVIIDAIRERKPPFSPEQVTSNLLPCCSNITSPKSLATATPAVFRQSNLASSACSMNRVPSRADLYVDLLPMINSCSIALLDNAKLDLSAHRP